MFSRISDFYISRSRLSAIQVSQNNFALIHKANPLLREYFIWMPIKNIPGEEYQSLGVNFEIKMVIQT